MRALNELQTERVRALVNSLERHIEEELVFESVARDPWVQGLHAGKAAGFRLAMLWLAEVSEHPRAAAIREAFNGLVAS